MRLNLRYIIPAMCGTCIALTVSVAAAVSGASDNEDISTAAQTKTESLVLHSYDFTAPIAYTAETNSAENEPSDNGETSESEEPHDIPTTAEMTEESADIGIGLSEEPAESMEITAETSEKAEDIPIEEDDTITETDKQSAETLPEADEPPAEVIPETDEYSAEAPEADKQSDEAPAETDVQPEATATGYDEPQRQAMLEAVNAVRAEYGLTALSDMPQLSDIAQQRARECAAYFSHTRPNGTRWYTLLEEAGLKRNVRAENIAYYYPTAQQALNSWLNDYSHRANILNSEAVYIGIGYYNDGYNAYWVQIFLGK